MENPTFRLEGIVKAQDDMQDFEGPLTLILQLLSKNKIEIQDIQISLLLDQYLEYLENMKSMDLEIASEFVAMASHLVYIKTKMLLNAGEEPTELEELMQSLEKLRNKDAYEKIKSVIIPFGEMYMSGGGRITKMPEPDPSAGEYRYRHEKTDLFRTMLEILIREAEEAQFEASAGRNIQLPRQMSYSIAEKSDFLIRRLKKGVSAKITALLYECRNRSELVATFMAILELCKDGRISISGYGEDAEIRRAVSL